MRTTTQEPLSSSDARDAILSSHQELRGLVSETIHCAEEDSTSSANGFEPLRAHARDLYRAFLAHMDFEERVLALALSDVIGRGSLLRAQVEQGHERQRATLASAISALEPNGVSGGRLVEGVRALAASILGDLETEETVLLVADLDAMAGDSPGG
jgi:hypothetical protein